MGFQQRDNYCYDCARYNILNGFYGCLKFRVHRNDEFDRLCGGKFKIPRQKKMY